MFIGAYKCRQSMSIYIINLRESPIINNARRISESTFFQLVPKSIKEKIMLEKINFSFALPSDSEGYIEYECPFCKEKFRLDKNLFHGEKENDELFCPLCSMKSSVQNFYTTECVEYMSQMQIYLTEVYLDKELKNAEKKSRGFIKYKSKNRLQEPKVFGLHPEIETKRHCKKCIESFKTKMGSNIVYCPYCGEII